MDKKVSKLLLTSLASVPLSWQSQNKFSTQLQSAVSDI